VDLWSYGCIIYALICGCLPYDHDDQAEIIRMTVEDKLGFAHPSWKHKSAEVKDLCKKLLHKKPNKRLSLEDALKHPWFNDCRNENEDN